MPTIESPSATQFSEQELAAWRGMLQVNASVTHALDNQMRTEHGMSVSSYEVLMFLAAAPERRLRMSQIASQVLLSRSGLTRLIDRLVEQGYVTRCVADTDGRGLFAELTQAGLAKFEAARLTHREGVRQFFLDRLNPTDQIALGDIWQRLMKG
jgi:DNA-binding MarR family transcriptional regulator